MENSKEDESQIFRFSMREVTAERNKPRNQQREFQLPLFL